MVKINYSALSENGRGVYALLPPGWYYPLISITDNNNSPYYAKERLLAIKHSEIDKQFHREMCEYWSKERSDYEEYAATFCSWMTLDPITLEDAASNISLLDVYMRHEFGEEVFSQRAYKPWGGGGVIDIESIDRWYARNKQINPQKYECIIKLPSGYDVNRINGFCKIFEWS